MSDTTNKMTREELQAQHPALFAALREEFMQAGATAERTRIQGVESQLIAGHEATIAAMKFDGKSNAGDAAQAIVAAEKAARTNAAAQLAADAPDPLTLAPAKTVAAVEKDKPLTRAEVDARAKEYMAANKGVDYLAAVKHITEGA